eukprot:m.253618 g.253618  ORF g.253618 m.253618 type:complete len:457 (-) comp18457_c0_seq1:164-1534(-)
MRGVAVLLVLASCACASVLSPAHGSRMRADKLSPAHARRATSMTMMSLPRGEANTLTPLWTAPLADWTNITSQYVWDGTQTAFFAAAGTTYFGITTAGGAFSLLDAASGKVLWTRTTWPAGTPTTWVKRVSGGSEHGLFVLQDATVYSLDLATGNTIWASPLPASLGTSPELFVYGQQIILSQESALVSLAAATGAVAWSVNNVLSSSGYRVDTNMAATAPRVAYIASDVASGDMIAYILDPQGNITMTQTLASADAYLADVDANTIFIIYLESSRICRYPMWCSSVPGGASLTGYSLNCYQGGATCGATSGGYAFVDINDRVRTHVFNYSTGAQIAMTDTHPVGHLVGLAQVASITVQSGSSIQILAFSQANMSALLSPTLASAVAYDIIANWHNEILIPHPLGFSFFFAAAGTLLTDYATMFPAGIVLSNCIVVENAVYFTSGRNAYAFSFPAS